MHFHRKGLFFAPDTGNGSGASGGQATTPAAETQNAGNGQQQATAQPDDKPTPITFESEAKFQERVEAILKDRLDREKRKSAEQADAARKKAEEEALAKNAEWQKLAETRGGELEKLTNESKVNAEKAEKYEKALNVQLDAAKKDLPAPVLGLLEHLDPAEQLEWIATNKATLVAQQAPATTPARTTVSAIPPSPAPATPAQLTAEQQAQARRSQAVTVQNNF